MPVHVRFERAFCVETGERWRYFEWRLGYLFTYAFASSSRVLCTKVEIVRNEGSPYRFVLLWKSTQWRLWLWGWTSNV